MLFCKYCEAYIENEEYIDTHVAGKKHLKNAEGMEGKWFKLVAASEIPSKEGLPRLQPVSEEPRVPIKANDSDWEM